MAKRIIALLLVVTLSLGVFPVGVFAQETEQQTQVNNGDMTVEGTNSFGTLLSKEIAQQDASEETDYPVGYNVIGLQVENGKATVAYSSLEEAVLVVAVYTEDGLRMVTSASTQVSPEEEVAEVTFDQELPAYFKVSAYLLDTYDYSPLCAAYETPLYTREMQDLLASTVADYDADRVLQLDDDDTTNFAVYAEDVIIIEEESGVNTVASIDDEAARYVIGNANEAFTSLREGDVFAYGYGEGEVLIVKVGAIEVDGTTVTITGGELDMEEVFSHVKIESTGDTGDVTVDDSTADEGVTYEGLVDDSQPYAQSRSIQPYAWDGSESLKRSLGFSISKKVSTNKGDNVAGVEAEVSVSGSLKMTLDISLSYYISTSYQFLEFKVKNDLTFDLKVTGELMINMLELGKIEFSPITGVFVRFRPYAQLRFTGEITFVLKYNCTSGFKVEHTKKGFTRTDLSTPAKTSSELNFEGTIFIGVDMHPQIVIISDKVANAELECLVGLEIKSTRVLATTEAPDENELHTCNRCYDGDISLVLKLVLKVQFLKMEKLKLVATLAERTSKIGDYYYSADHRKFGWKDCPYRSYLMTVTLRDQNLSNKSGIEVTAYMLEERTQTSLGKTDKDGIVKAYLKRGNYVIEAKSGDTTYREAKNFTQPCSVILGHSGSGDDNAFVQGNIDFDDFEAHDFGQIVRSEACGDKGDNVTWTLYSSGHFVVSGKGKIADITEGDSMIGTLYYEGYENLHVHIENGVTGIGDKVFANFRGNIWLYLSEDVTDISSTAFLNSKVYLEELDPDNPVYTTDDYNYALYKNKKTLVYAFSYYMGDGAYTIPSGVTEIGEYAFYNKRYLPQLNIPKTLTKIAVNALHGADCSFSVDAANPVFSTDADGRALIRNRTELFWVSRAMSGTYQIPSGIKVIGESAFEYCQQLTNVTIPQGVTTIKDNAFLSCFELGRGLGQINLPNTVTSIGNNAFYNTQLSTVEIPNSVTSIGDYAFADLNYLQHITIGSGVKTMGKYVFSRANNLLTVHIAQGVKEIGYGMLAECGDLEEIVIPSSVTKIGDYAFWNSEIGWIKIPSTVNTIGDYAFSGCSFLSYVSIPQGVTHIGDYAFQYCIRLESLVIPDSVTYLGDGVCKDSRGLRQVQIGSGVQAIPAEAFLNCEYLETATVAFGPTEIGNDAFSGCTRLAEFTIPASVTSIGDYAFDRCYTNNWALPESVEAIGAYAFRHCIREGDVLTIPAGTTFIGDYAFDSCEGKVLIDANNPVFSHSADENLLIKNGTTVIWATKSLYGEYTIPDGITAIGDGVFASSYINAVNIPNTVTQIGSRAFYETNLEQITLPKELSVIEEYVFSECYSLASVFIPEAVTVIEENAFFRCYPLDIYYAGTKSQWNAISIQAGNESLFEATLHCNDVTLAGLPALPADVAEMPTELDISITQEAPITYAVWNGEYGKEENSSAKTASFTGLVPGGNYVMLSMRSLDAEDLLSGNNLLYITQGIAGEDGTLFFRYSDRVEESVTYVVACGPSHKNLKDASITFPEMNELDGEQVVNPTVVYDGETLEEGRDYVLLGTVYVTKAGTYSCTIRGINDYTGTVNCTYTVQSHKHIYTDYVSNGDATCKADGTKTAKCAHCDETDTVKDAGTKLAHKWDAGVVTTQPTDKKQGVKTFTCTLCKDTKTEPIPVTDPVHTHSFGEWEVEKAATGAEAGTEIRKCDCGETESREIPRLVNPFEDVEEGKFYYEPVLWAYYGGITTGKDATHFNPSGFCTRSQVVTFLWRAAGEPEPTSSVNPFPDVPENKFYTKAVLWAVEQGITGGYKDGTFGPNDSCTRSQIVTFLWRYFGEPQPASTNNPFPDVPEGKFYTTAVLWAVEQEITGGYKDGTFGPNKTCTRDQIVTFLYRAMVE